MGDNRIELYALKKAGLTQKAITAQLDVDPSTISRKLKKNNRLRGYRPRQAHRLACARKAQAHGHRISKATWRPP
jgi:IS30 family transposase